MADVPTPSSAVNNAVTTLPKASTFESAIAILCLVVLPLVLLFPSILLNDHILSSYSPILVGTMGLPYILYGIYSLQKGRVWLMGPIRLHAILTLFGAHVMNPGFKEGNDAKQVAIRYIVFGIVIITAFIFIGVTSHTIYSTLPPDVQAVW